MPVLVRYLMFAIAIWAFGAGAASAYTLVSQQDHFLIEMPSAPQLEKSPGEFGGVVYDQNSWTVQRGQKGWIVSVAEFKGYAVGQDVVGAFVNEVLKDCDCTLRSRVARSVDGVSGLEFIGDGSNGFAVRGLAFPFGDKLLYAVYIGPKGTEAAAAVGTYLNSLHFLRQ